MIKRMLWMMAIVGAAAGALYGLKAYVARQGAAFVSAAGVPAQTVSAAKARIDTWQPRLEAVGSLHAFFGAAGDADLADRMGKMIASTSAFGANQNIDTVPTGRYVFASPF